MGHGGLGVRAVAIGGVTNVTVVGAAIAKVGGVGGRGGFHGCLGYVLVELLCVAAADGSCDGGEQDGEGDETNDRKYASDFTFVGERVWRLVGLLVLRQMGKRKRWMMKRWRRRTVWLAGW